MSVREKSVRENDSSDDESSDLFGISLKVDIYGQDDVTDLFMEEISSAEE